MCRILSANRIHSSTRGGFPRPVDACLFSEVGVRPMTSPMLYRRASPRIEVAPTKWPRIHSWDTTDNTSIVWNETFNRCERLHVRMTFPIRISAGAVPSRFRHPSPSRPDIALLGEIVYDFHQVAFRDSMCARDLRNGGVQASRCAR